MPSHCKNGSVRRPGNESSDGTIDKSSFTAEQPTEQPNSQPIKQTNQPVSQSARQTEYQLANRLRAESGVVVSSTLMFT